MEGGGSVTDHVCIVVFSYNRAMQLDYLIRTIHRFVTIPHYEIVVVYHCQPNHDLSYSRVMERYAGRVSFLRRSRRKRFLTDILPAFFRFYGNAYWYWKYPYLRRDLDDFKLLFEGLLDRTTAQFILFFTDDAIVYDTFSVPERVLAAIRENPAQCSYKALVGRNIAGAPENLLVQPDHCSWDYYDERSGTHWAWPFAVDGTVYHKDNLRRLVRKFLYHSPITLEAFGVKYVRRHRLFRYGMSPATSKVISITINRVSTITDNFAANINVEFLMTKFVEGFELEYTLPSLITQTALVPDRVRLVRGEDASITLLPSRPPVGNE